jgi:hypothetical protein
MSNYLICHIEGHSYDLRRWCTQCGDSNGCVHLLDHTCVHYYPCVQEAVSNCQWCHEQLTLTSSEDSWFDHYSKEGFLRGVIAGGGVSAFYRRGSGRFCLPQYRDGQENMYFIPPPKFTSFFD